MNGEIRFFYRVAVVCILMFGFCVADADADAVAQDPGPINAERPSFSSSPLALATGFWQIEAGYQYTRNGGERSMKEQTLPNALLRFGIFQNLELQLNGVGFKHTRTGGMKTDGSQDVNLGIKWQVNASDAVVPIGLFVGFSVPVGNSELTSDEYDPSVGIFWSHSGSLEWFGTAMAQRAGGQYSYDNAVGISLALNETTGSFIELHSSFPQGAGPAHNLNAGITWLLAYALQVDIHGAVGLNGRANDYSAGFGIAYRF